MTTETTGWSMFGILAHRQPDVGDDPDQDQEQAEDGGEDRPADAELGQAHRRQLCAGRLDDLDLRLVAQADMAVDDHGVAGGEALR